MCDKVGDVGARKGDAIRSWSSVRGAYESVILSQKYSDTSVYLANSQGDQHCEGVFKKVLNNMSSIRGKSVLVRRYNTEGRCYCSLLSPDRQVGECQGGSVAALYRNLDNHCSGVSLSLQTLYFLRVEWPLFSGSIQCSAN